jgi:hypothetical protein
MTTLDLTTDTIDVRDIIDRYEELTEFVEAASGKDAGDYGGFDIWLAAVKQSNQDITVDLVEELRVLVAILQFLEGEGGDEQWRGDWYPMLLIRESYFTNYAREMLEDCGTIPRDFPSWVIIDWEATADNVQVDYRWLEIGDTTYWYR